MTPEQRKAIEERITEVIIGYVLNEKGGRNWLEDSLMFGRDGMLHMTEEELIEMAEMWDVDIADLNL